jgi:hypothetical protein
MSQLYYDDDLKIIDPELKPGRIAYVDESGDFGFDFSKPGTKRYYIICAVIIDKHHFDELEAQAELIRGRNFGPSKMKSKEVGGNIKRRKKILSELIHVDFKTLVLVVDKQRFYKDSPLKLNKATFIKFLHNKLYQKLYRAYPKLSIIFDETGYTEFQESFKKYVKSNRPKYNMFNEYDFDFLDDEESVFVQFADMIVGSINRELLWEEAKYIRILKGNILDITFFPREFEDLIVDTNEMSGGIFNEDIIEMSYRCVLDYINKNKNSDEERIVLQIAFLNYLLYQFRFISPTRYVYSDEILQSLGEYSLKKVTKDYFKRNIVAPLRDSGVIIASSNQGYKIPMCEKDIIEYVKQTDHTVAPMLRRLGMCRDEIFIKTEGKLDILDKELFTKYKKYFD